jgi:LuxR family maltose regulon positive regulatory protein
MKEHPAPATVSWGFYLLGVVHYHRNELQNAEEKLTRVVRAYYADSPMNFAHGAFALALTCQALGKPDEAKEIGRSVVIASIETHNSAMLRVARAFEAELALRQGRLTEASRWVRIYDAKPFVPAFRFYMPQLTAVKIWLAQNTTDGQGQAADLLDPLLDFLTSIHNHRFRMEALALQALLHDARGEDSAGSEKLSEALAVAEPGGFIRVFVDLGPKMAELLGRLIQRGDARVDYIGQILAAFRADERASAESRPEPQTVPSPSLKTSASGGLLTERELEILGLLEHPLRNHEIAEKLYVSVTTVKTHLHNIYKKLNARGRLDAVAKARDLGVLSQR